MVKYCYKYIIVGMLSLALYALPTHGKAYGNADATFKLTVAEVEHAIANALQQSGAADIVSAKITNNRKPIIYQSNLPLSAEIKTLEYDDEKQSWMANLFVNQNGKVLSALPLSGKYVELVMAPVFKTRMYKGDVITADDLEEKKFELSKTRKDTIYKKEVLIGKTPQRVVSSGRPIRISEIKNPDIIKKGDTVSMKYLTNYMTISTKGVALEAGAKGNSISVKNEESGKSVQAIITSAHAVKISSIGSN